MKQFSVIKAYTQGIRLFFKHIGLFAAAIGIVVTIELVVRIAQMFFTARYFQLLRDKFITIFPSTYPTLDLSFGLLITLINLPAIFIGTWFWLGYSKITLQVIDRGTGHLASLFRHFNLSFALFRVLIPTFTLYFSIFFADSSLLFSGFFLVCLKFIFLILFGFLMQVIIDQHTGFFSALRNSLQITKGHLLALVFLWLPALAFFIIKLWQQLAFNPPTHSLFVQLFINTFFFLFLLIISCAYRQLAPKQA